MRRTLAIVVFLLFPLLTQTTELGKFATLSRKEIAEGWILLFDGKTTFGWTAPTGSKWSIIDGMLAPRGDKPALLVTTTAFADYILSFNYRAKNRKSLQILVNMDAASKEVPSLSRTAFAPVARIWNEAKLHVQKGQLTKAEFTDPLAGGLGVHMGGPSKPGRRTGHIALSGNGFIVRNIKLRPLNTKALFNGKDLSGWKVFPRRKSKFGVTKEGWLSLKNGSGDLQTQGQWADFILQLDCRTNGKYLNSGVFFRCLPGQYQQGYEAQIHNKFLDPPGKSYTLSFYDPKTHKLIGKKKVKYRASDYGTGAIYRRQPARVQAAKDREWFTMTVVARGRHLATWVNGLQVTDWTDNRPLADNARKGCYLKKGPISLQGHDPTTDLNFRNLRLAELPAHTKR